MTLRRGSLPILDDCEKCPLAVDGNPENPVLGVGSTTPKFIIITDSPGYGDINHGIPLSGKSGSIFNTVLQSVNLKRDDVYITNAALCHGGVGDEREKKLEKGMECCKRRLERELAELPKVPILTLGKAATQLILNEPVKITDISGSLFEVDGRYIIPTAHPVSIERSGQDKGGGRSSDLLFWALIYDVSKIARLAEGSIEPLSEEVYITQDKDETNKYVAEVLALAVKSKSLAIDLETVGVSANDCYTCLHCEGHDALETMHARIQAIGLSTSFNSKFFSTAVLWDLINPQNKELFEQLLLDHTVDKIFHNRGYDEIVLERNGYPVRGPITCTLLMHHAGFPGFPHKLQRVASQFFVTRAWKSEFRSNKDKKDIEALLRYCALDVGRTFKLKAPLVQRLAVSKTYKVYEIDSIKAEIGKHMQLWGMPVDMQRNQEYHHYFIPKLKVHRDALTEAIVNEEFKKNFLESIATERAKRKRKSDSDDFDVRQKTRLQELEEDFDELGGLNLDAKDHVIGYLRACGVPLTKFTKKGGVSTSKDVLEELLSYPPVRHLLEYRKLNKLFDTFVEPLPYLLVPSNYGPRLHAQWKPTIISGRFGTSPNVQNWSKGLVKKKETYENWLLTQYAVPNLRWQVAPIKGRILIGGDFRALEARNIGRRANDAYLCEVFSQDRDIHTELCVELYKERFTSLDEKDPQRGKLRDIVKRVEYAFFYGAAVTTAWQTLLKEGVEIPLSDVQDIFGFLAKKTPGVILYHRELKGKVFKEKALRSFLHNRARFFPLGFGEDSIIKNFEAQADGADICDTALIKLYNRLNEFHDMFIIQQGHDAIVLECDEKEVDRAKAVLKECMEQEYDGMKYTVEIDVGYDWGSV